MQRNEQRPEAADQHDIVGVMGLGAMGQRIAKRLLEGGRQVMVYNRTPERAQGLVDAGATLANDPEHLARCCRVILEVSRDASSAKALWSAAEPGMTDGHVAAIVSTLTPDAVREIAEPSVARFVDAPVVGSTPQAEAGQLVHLASGEPQAVAELKPILAHTGTLQHIAGALGSGTALKLAVNAFFGVQVAAIAELLHGLPRAGVNAADGLALMAKLPITAPTIAALGGLMLADKVPPMFPVELVAKDMGYAVQALGGASKLPATALAHATYRRGVETGHGDINIHGIHRLFVDA